jgi:predicted nucleic acid-binding protein
VSVYLDSSVLVAALVEDDPYHRHSLDLLLKHESATWIHGLAETFATLTGGRLGFRIPPKEAAQLLEQSLWPNLRVLELSTDDTRAEIAAACRAGVRGGAVYDFLHLGCARRANVTTLYTLNLRHFVAVARDADPQIRTPDIATA